MRASVQGERAAAAELRKLAAAHGYTVKRSLMTGRWHLFGREKKPVTRQDGTTAFSFEQAIRFFQRAAHPSRDETPLSGKGRDG